MTTDVTEPTTNLVSSETEPTAPPATASQSTSWTRQLIAVFLIFAFFFTIQTWDETSVNESNNPDNLARLYQVESLANGQGWYDLDIDRFGLDGVDMHWTRHVDTVATPVYLIADIFGSQEFARSATFIAVPLIFLFVALWAVGGIARALWPHRAAPLFAMGLFGATAGSFHLKPGRIDHHGFHLMLVVLIIYFLVASKWKWAHAAAGVGVGLAATSSLETIPILAAILAGVGLTWLLDLGLDRQNYITFGVGTMAGWLSGALLLAPPSRIWGQECDVFSLGFVGLISIPAIGLAAVGGRDWTRSQRFGALAAIGAGGVGWIAIISPNCATGPYSDIPQVLHDQWLSRIQEIESLISEIQDNMATLIVAATFVAALIILVVRARRTQSFDNIILFSALLVASLLAFTQLRGVPLAQAVAAPVTGGALAGLHHRVLERRAGRLYRVLVVVGFICIPVIAFGSSSVEEPATCHSQIDGSLPTGRVAADMEFSTQMLLTTDHHLIATAYHRAWPGTMQAYDLFTANPDEARQIATDGDIDYIAICTTERSFVELWGELNPGSLSEQLSAGNPPEWLIPVTEEPAIFYRVAE